jgi:hypothetical protein
MKHEELADFSAEAAPRSGDGSAKPSDGEWGPGESHSLGRGGAAPSERAVEIVDERISFAEVAREAALQASLRPVALELSPPPKASVGPALLQGLALVVALGLGVGTSAYLSKPASQPQQAAQPRALAPAAELPGTTIVIEEGTFELVPREATPTVEPAIEVAPASPEPRISTRVEPLERVPPAMRELPVREAPVREVNLPATPSRDDVRSALAAVRPAVLACANGRGGVASVRINIGASGRVRGTEVGGDFAGTPEGSCIARAVRGARFPAFSQPSFSVSYPFSL